MLRNETWKSVYKSKNMKNQLTLLQVLQISLGYYFTIKFLKNGQNKE